MAKKRILVIDPAEYMKDFISSRVGVNFEVLSAPDEVEALQMCVEYRPSIVTTELQVSQTTGAEITRKILEIQPETRIIVVSSNHDEKSILSAINCGAAAYVWKPLLIKNILKILDYVQQDDFRPTIFTCA